MDVVTAFVLGVEVSARLGSVASGRFHAQGFHPTDAQFSIPYLVATGLVRRRTTLDDLEPAALADPAVQRIVASTDYAVDRDSRFPAHCSGEVVVELADGESLRARRDVNPRAPVPQCPSAPLGDEQIRAKYDANAGRAVSTAAAERISDLVTGSDEGSRRVLAALRDCS